MTTLYITHPACLEHDTPYGHPERADRLRAVNQGLAEARFGALQRGEAPEADL
ncbi:MAG TPA: histone deacetylase family protein, partial [Rhodopseudomonas sp.]